MDENKEDINLESNVSVVLGDNYIEINIENDCSLEECISKINTLIGKEIVGKISNLILLDSFPNVKKKKII